MQCTLIFMLLHLLDSQIWWRLSTNTLSSQRKMLLYFTLSLNWSCSVIFWCTTTPELYVPGRQMLSSNYSSSIKQFLVVWEPSVTCFVTERVVLSSVNYSFDTFWKVCHFLIPQRSIALEWLALHTWVFMLKKSTALAWLALRFVCCVLGVCAAQANRF